MALTFFLGLWFFRKGRGACLFSLASSGTFLISLVAFISFICLYFYETPTHHCPFCVLQKEYNYAGYPIYFLILTGAISGMGAGAIDPFRKIKSLQTIAPSIQKRLVIISLLAYVLFAMIAGYQMAFSNLKLGG